MKVGRFNVDGFLLALAAAIATAALAPGLGASGGPLRVDLLASGAVVVVFFLHGVQLPLETLAAGIRELRLHVLVQSSTWLLFPALGLLVLPLGGRLLPSGLALGFFFLCASSSTITSSVALTAVAGGNVPGALFNATLSALLGVVLTPLYAGVVADASQLGGSLPSAVGSVALKLLLPLALGQLLRWRLAGLFARYRDATGFVDRAAIVLIVYGAFCDSIGAGVWTVHSLGAVLLVAALSLLLFACVTLAIRSAARALGFGRAEEIAALFCGSQKSLVNGLPIAKVLFGGSPDLGLIVLPLMLYHQVQLTLGAVIARRYRAQRDRSPV